MQLMKSVWNTSLSPTSPLKNTGKILGKTVLHIAPESLKINYRLVGITATSVIGVIIVALGGAKIFGPIGTVGSNSSIIAGGAVSLVAIIVGIVSTTGIHRKKPNSLFPYSPLGEEALAFARKELRRCRGFHEIKPYTWRIHSPPINKEINLVYTLHSNATDALNKAIKKHQDKDEPWAEDEVIQAADNYMKLSYVLGCLTLDDLPAFTAELKRKGDFRTYAQALTKQDSYLYQTFFSSHLGYHWLRNKGGHTKDEITDPAINRAYDTYVDEFYIPGIKNDWRTLYNEYCARIRWYVPDSPDGVMQPGGGFGKALRFARWAQKDENRSTFKLYPDSIPTAY
jgi:hypothetical protein